MKILARVRYWLLLNSCRAAGALPTWVLYHCVQDFLYFIIYKVVHYRLNVVRNNLRNSFPEKTPEQLHEIERRFYRHLSEVVVDTVDLVNISRKELEDRIHFTNVDEVEAQMQGKDWIAALAHYGCWEYFGAYQFHTASQVIGVYRPLHEKSFDEYYLYMRSRFGLRPVPMHSLLRCIVRNRKCGQRQIVGLIADQTPPEPEINHWFDFLHQPTPFFLGAEKLALKFGMPVYVMKLNKVNRAHYEVSFHQIYDGKEPVDEFEITKRYAAELEKMICRSPELWMWSHRRWKHKPPVRMAVESREVSVCR